MKIFVLLVAVVACVEGAGFGRFLEILGDEPERWEVAERCIGELEGRFSDPPTNPERCNAVKHVLKCDKEEIIPYGIRLGLRSYARREWGCRIKFSEL